MRASSVVLWLCVQLYVVYGELSPNHFPQSYTLHQKGQNILASSLFHDVYARRLDAGGAFSSDQEKLLSAVASKGHATFQCLNDTRRFLQDLDSGELYAWRMLDALGKPPPGLLEGAFAWYGSYDSCVNITAGSNQARIQGQYCVYSQGSMAKDPTVPVSLALKIGLCIPSSCNANSTKALIDAGLFALRILNISLGESNVVCQEMEQKPLTGGDIAALVIIGVLVVLVIIGTLIDLVLRSVAESYEGAYINFSKPHGKDTDKSSLKITSNGPPAPVLWMKFFLTFSPITNGEKIFKTDNTRGDIGCLHGLRLISMWWVMICHVFVTGGLTVDNPISSLSKLFKRFTFMAIANASFCVDTFFLLSGLLLTYLVMKELKKTGGKLNWPMLYFHRFWRLTPLYMFVILISTTVYNRLLAGPLLLGKENLLAGNCVKYWWTNLLYINNFYPISELDMCLVHTWYLANDMQFFIISPIFLILLNWHAFTGFIALFALLVGGMITTGVLSTYYGTPAFPAGIAAPKPLHDMVRGGWDIIYDKPYCRVQAYAIGMILGYVLYATDCKKIYGIKKRWIFLGWLAAAASALTVLYGPYWDIRDGVVLSYDVSSLYNCTARTGWCLAIAWVIFACVHGYGGFVNTILSWKAFVPLSRLTYAAYLIHLNVYYGFIGTRSVMLHYTDLEMAYLIIPTVVFAYVVAFILNLLVESPMIGLEKIIFKRKSRDGK